MVFIKTIEQSAPSCKETPETAADTSALSIETAVEELRVPELLKIYTPIFVRIKHAYHHLDRMRIETREIPIDQRLPQLSLCQPACPRSIDCLEEWEKRAVSTAAARSRCPGRSGRRWWTPMVSLWWRTEAVVLGWGR